MWVWIFLECVSENDWMACLFSTRMLVSVSHVQLCYFFFFSTFIYCMCQSLQSADPPGSACRGKTREVCVCAEQYWSIHTHKGCVSASSVMGSGRWSTGAQCRATWSVGSAWLECHQSEPSGPRNQAPKPSLRHTPPENTRARKNLKTLTRFNTTDLFLDASEGVRGELRWAGCKNKNRIMSLHACTQTPAGEWCLCYSHLGLWEWNCHYKLIEASLLCVYVCVCALASMCKHLWDALPAFSGRSMEKKATPQTRRDRKMKKVIFLGNPFSHSHNLHPPTTIHQTKLA